MNITTATLTTPQRPLRITETPGHRHAYWLLTGAVDGEGLERANRRLAHSLGADPVSTDAARILRPPGTFSHKSRFPRPVRGEHLRFDVRYSLDEVVGRLSDPETPVERVATRDSRDANADPLLDVPPEEYVQRMLRVPVPRSRKVACPFHADEHPSLHVYETPERGWFCFGRCRRGGTIYDLAAPLYGYGTRGEDFLALRAELLTLFGLDA